MTFFRKFNLEQISNYNKILKLLQGLLLLLLANNIRVLNWLIKFQLTFKCMNSNLWSNLDTLLTIYICMSINLLKAGPAYIGNKLHNLKMSTTLVSSNFSSFNVQANYSYFNSRKWKKVSIINVNSEMKSRVSRAKAELYSLGRCITHL